MHPRATHVQEGSQLWLALLDSDSTTFLSQRETLKPHNSEASVLSYSSLSRRTLFSVPAELSLSVCVSFCILCLYLVSDLPLSIHWESLFIQKFLRIFADNMPFPLYKFCVLGLNLIQFCSLCLLLLLFHRMLSPVQTCNSKRRIEGGREKKREMTAVVQILIHHKLLIQ